MNDLCELEQSDRQDLKQSIEEQGKPSRIAPHFGVFRKHKAQGLEAISWLSPSHSLSTLLF